MITKEQALKIIEEQLIKEAKYKASKCTITDKLPDGVYRTWPEDEEVWYCSRPSGNHNMLIPDQVVIISKKSGKILFEGKVGDG